MFLSLIELKHKRAFYVVLQGEVLQVTKCRRKNKQPSLWNMKSFDTLDTISWKMDSRDRFYGFSLLFNIFAERKSYYAGIMLDAPSIVLCSKLCRHNVSDPRAFPWLQVSPVLPWLQVFLRFSQVTSSRAAFKDLPEFTTSWMLSLIAFLLALTDALWRLIACLLVDYYLFQSSPALGPSQKLSQSYCQRCVSWKHVGDVVWILQSQSKYQNQKTTTRDPTE